MSEVMAIILASLATDPDTHPQIISKIVAGWKPAGVIRSAWKKEPFDFDTSLDEQEIIAELKKINSFLASVGFKR